MGAGLAFELKPPDPDAARELGRACGLGAATAQVLLHRDLGDEARTREFLDARLSGLTPPDEMADRALAADRIASAIRSRERVVVFGDYDVDGTTSAVVLSGILRELGGAAVTLAANRFEGGYGFSDTALDRCIEAGASMIVTCDCGSSDHDRIARARSRGVDVVVVDHHLVPEEPLPAFAFLNPHRLDCPFPYQGLASAGLALSLGGAVRRAMGRDLDLKSWLDLVALGTIADVAPLDGDNRRLVRAGLRLLADPGARPGIVALRDVANLKGRHLGARDVSFRLAPRLNAAGRLGDPRITVELLEAATPEQARGLAARVEQINEERKQVERRVTAEARAQALEVYGEAPDRGVVVASEGWHRGVVGITAARLVDSLGVPVLALAVEDGVAHGSGRAPDGFPLYDALSMCAPLLLGFGGHQAAAGLSVAADRIEPLRADFAAATARFPMAPAGPPLVDVCLDGVVFPVPSAADLMRLEPTGEANPEPLYAVTQARVVSARTVGEGGAHLKLELEVGPQRLSAFGFDLGSRAAGLGATVDALGHVRLDTWRGGDAVELHLVAVQGG